MAPRPAVKIPPETLATARRLLGRRAELEAASRNDYGDEIAQRIEQHTAGINDALAMLWQGVMDTQNGQGQ